jgi:hypothetical protein
VARWHLSGGCSSPTIHQFWDIVPNLRARGETRTPTASRPPDPKSGASANSATLALPGQMVEERWRTGRRETHRRQGRREPPMLSERTERDYRQYVGRWLRDGQPAVRRGWQHEAGRPRAETRVPRSCGVTAWSWGRHWTSRGCPKAVEPHGPSRQTSLPCCEMSRPASTAAADPRLTCSTRRVHG